MISTLIKLFNAHMISLTRKMTLAVILTISDTCSAGTAEDTSGPYISTKMSEWRSGITIERHYVPDNVSKIQLALQTAVDKARSLSGAHVFISSGGTGLSHHDVTVAAIAPMLDKQAAGIMSSIVSKCAERTPFAMLSNPLVGIKENMLVICLPGSKKAVTEYLELLLPLMNHVLDLISNEKESISTFHKTLMQTPHQCPHKGGQKNTRVYSEAQKRREVAFRSRQSTWPMLSVSEALVLITDAAAMKRVINDRTINVPVLVENSSGASSLHNGLSAYGHVTAYHIIARENVPNYRASIKDGYAVVSDDGVGEFKVGTVSKMGENNSGAVVSGTVARVTTGGTVPLGADAVVQVEDTELVSATTDGEEDVIRVLSKVSPGTDIRPVGSDITVDEVLLPAKCQLNAAEIGLLASQGVENIEVFRKPNIALLSTGNELVLHKASQVQSGQVRDSNSPAIVRLLQEDGYSVSYSSHLPDALQHVKDGLQAALKVSDIIITTGGVSMGECDYIKDALPEIGATVHFGRVHMKPGKPTTFASFANGQLYFGLPGNPVSAMVTYKLFVLPALKVWEGRDPEPNIIKVPLPETRILDPRPEYIRGVYSSGSVKLTGGQCSSRLLSMKSANVLLKLPPQSQKISSIEAGTIVDSMVIGML